MAEVKRLRAELASLRQMKTELESIARQALQEKAGAISLLDKMSSTIDNLNGENDRLAELLEDFRATSSEIMSEAMGAEDVRLCARVQCM